MSGTGGSGASSPTTESRASGSAAPRTTASRVYRLHLSRDWVAYHGPRRHRHTTVVFTLRKPAVVEFLVLEVAPDCRRVARFRVAGLPGVNRVRLGPRVGHKFLRPGSYRLLARTLPAGRKVVDARLVVVSRASRSEIAAARGAYACSFGTSSGFGAEAGAGASASGGPAAGGSGTTGKQAASQGKKPASRHHGVLGARFAHQAVKAAENVPLWLYLLLGLAIMLLALAALPLRAAPKRAAGLLARRRAVLALVGAAALVVVTVAYTLH